MIRSHMLISGVRGPYKCRRAPSRHSFTASLLLMFAVAPLSCTEVLQNYQDTCVPDTLKCVSGDVYKCKEDGSAFVIAKECAPEGPCTGDPPDCEVTKGTISACETDAECEQQLGTIGECFRAVCSSGTCQVQDRDGETCTDASECTVGDTCAGGVCLGTLIECNDDNPCTKDECDPTSGCTTSNLDGNACDDGSPCTVDDTCGNAECKGTPKICNDDNPCTEDTCDASSGECASIAISSPCDDGDACTSSDLCQAGVCTGSPAFACIEDADCAACDSNDPCKGTPQCGEDGFCILDPTTAFQCPQEGLGSCEINQCVNDDGDPTCQTIGLEDGTQCSDGSECTVGDVCQSGSCVGTVDSSIPGCGVFKLTWWQFTAGNEQATDGTYILQSAAGAPIAVGSCVDTTYRIQAAGPGIQ